ncbi:MAG TPA: hypothetical protein VLU95_02400 [Candidatus Acidoferrum sp.]|nr:hypothetical protein [Candidatus Acidoferrum sp.]
MGEEKTAKKGHSVAISGVIGFVVAALLIGMIIGGAISLLVIAPYVGQFHQQSNSGQTNTGNPNSNYPNNNNNPNGYNNNQVPTNNPYNNDQNGYNNGPTGSPSDYNNQPNTGNQSNNQNNNNSQNMVNNNPSITSPTAQYSSTGSQFSVSTPNQNGGKDSGTITADVTCVVQQSGNNMQLDLTVNPTSVPQSLSQDIQTSNSVSFNFAGTISGSQINAQASGTGGQDNTSPTFSLNLSGSFGSNILTITITSASGSQISISTLHSITLQSS